MYSKKPPVPVMLTYREAAMSQNKNGFGGGENGELSESCVHHRHGKRQPHKSPNAFEELLGASSAPDRRDTLGTAEIAKGLRRMPENRKTER